MLRTHDGWSSARTQILPCLETGANKQTNGRTDVCRAVLIVSDPRTSNSVLSDQPANQNDVDRRKCQATKVGRPQGCAPTRHEGDQSFIVGAHPCGRPGMETIALHQNIYAINLWGLRLTKKQANRRDNKRNVEDCSRREAADSVSEHAC